MQNPQLSIAVLAVPVVAVAMLVAISTSEYRHKVGRPRIAGSTAAAIDVWPPLLAYPVASFAITIAASMPGNVRSFALVEPGQPLHMLAIAAFIAIIGYLRARTSGQAVSFLTSLMIVAQIIICLACEAVSHFAGVFGLIGGPFLIVVVALALDILYAQPKPL